MACATFAVPRLSQVELSLYLTSNPPRKIYSAAESRVSVYWTLPSNAL